MARIRITNNTPRKLSLPAGLGVVQARATIEKDIDTTRVDIAQSSLISLKQSNTIAFDIFVDDDQKDADYYTATDTDEAIADGPGGGSVTSVFGRTGAVVATAADYSADEVSFAGAGITATNVEDAIVEVNDDLQTVAGDVATLTTDVSNRVIVAGQIGGTPSSPTVLGLRTTSGGGTNLTLGAVADGEYLRRSGATIVGGPGGGGGGGPANVLCVSGFVSNATPSLGTTYLAANTVARGANAFSIAATINVKRLDASGPQVIASCWDGTNGYYIQVEGRQISFIVNTVGGLRTSTYLMTSPFTSKFVQIVGAYSGDAGFAFSVLSINNVSFIVSYNGATNGTYVAPAGGSVFTIGASESGASNGAVRCRINGVGYYPTMLDDATMADIYEDTVLNSYHSSLGSPTNLWAITDVVDYPGATWTATVGPANLTRAGAGTVTQETIYPYWA